MRSNSNFSAIPYAGEKIIQGIRVSFAVENPTLKRFFYAFHFILPFILPVIIRAHIIFFTWNRIIKSIRAKNIPFYSFINDIEIIIN